MAGSRPATRQPSKPADSASSTPIDLPSPPNPNGFPDPIPGIIPFGTVTLFGGASGVGKTTMLAEWCRRWRDGRPICGYPTNPPTAFCYISGDRAWIEYQPMFNAVGFPDIRHYALAEDPTISLASLRKPFGGGDLFVKVLDHLQVPPGAHVLVDPASPLFITGDPNRQRDVAVSMIGFSRRCHEYHINLTCTVHFSKQKADPRQRYVRPQDRIAGSMSFAGFSCTQVYLCDPEGPKQPYSLLGWTPRHRKAEEFRFVRDEGGLFVPYVPPQAGASEPSETLEQVCRAFPVPPDEITLEALVAAVHVLHGLSRATVKRALQALIRAQRVIRMGRGHYRRVGPVAAKQSKPQ